MADSEGKRQVAEVLAAAEKAMAVQLKEARAAKEAMAVELKEAQDATRQISLSQVCTPQRNKGLHRFERTHAPTRLLGSTRCSKTMASQKP